MIPGIGDRLGPGDGDRAGPGGRPGPGVGVAPVGVPVRRGAGEVLTARGAPEATVR